MAEENNYEVISLLMPYQKVTFQKVIELTKAQYAAFAPTMTRID